MGTTSEMKSTSLKSSPSAVLIDLLPDLSLSEISKDARCRFRDSFNSSVSQQVLSPLQISLCV